MSAPADITHDRDLRGPLASALLAQHGHEAGTAIWHELTVCGSRARIDLAVVNGLLAGYEIKSGADTLARLPAQIRYYGRVFDRLTLVCDQRHLPRAEALAPGWWGLWVHRDSGFEEHRPPSPNPEPSARWQAELLWRDEMLAVLRRRNALRGVKTKPRRDLVGRLVESLPPTELASEVRFELRRRLRRRAELGV